jgi:hypothetical protein
MEPALQKNTMEEEYWRETPLAKRHRQVSDPLAFPLGPAELKRRKAKEETYRKPEVE